jgi:hypothetical protein
MCEGLPSEVSNKHPLAPRAEDGDAVAVFRDGIGRPSLRFEISKKSRQMLFNRGLCRIAQQLRGNDSRRFLFEFLQEFCELLRRNAFVSDLERIGFLTGPIIEANTSRPDE